jgi:nitrogen fixation NifU-like protein
VSADLSDLYQQVILDHYRNPRGVGKVENATHSAFADNPLCGDLVAISARVTDGVIEEIKHESSGCAICVASTSMMVERALGRQPEEFAELAEKFYTFAKGEGGEFDDKLQAFSNVSKFPMRVKCATLGWHTLERALNSK